MKAVLSAAMRAVSLAALTVAWKAVLKAVMRAVMLVAY